MTYEHTLHFNAIKTRIANHTENTYYNPQIETRIKCDASRSGLGAALEQLTVNGWKPFSFASRFLNSNEERYSINELELLGVVWSVEYINNYLYAKEFSIITYHRALLSILKEHKSNTSYNSCLSRWVDRLLPYQFKIEHLPGAKMGLVDYIYRNPYQPAKSISKDDKEFFVVTLSRIQTDAKLIQTKTNISATQLNKIYLNTKIEKKKSTIPQANQILNINSATPISLKQNILLPVTQMHHSNLSSFKHSILDGLHAARVRLTQNSSKFAKRELYSIFIPFNHTNLYSKHATRVHLTSSLAQPVLDQSFIPFKCTNFDSQHASRVRLTQNQLTPAEHNNNTLASISPNHTIFYCDIDPRLRFTQNKLTTAGHNTHLLTQPHTTQNSNASFAIQASKHQINPALSSHSTNTINSTLQLRFKYNHLRRKIPERRHSLTKIHNNSTN